MAGPWEQFQQPAGPWSLFGGVATPPDEAQARSLADAVWHGLQSSATGLALRGKLPDQQLPENAPWYHRLPSSAASMAADLPLSIVAAIPGMAAGGAVGSAVPVVGTAAGAVVGGGAAGFAAPMALRDALMTAYSQNHARTWDDVWEITKSALKGGGKGAVIGGVTMGAGRLVGGALGRTTSAAGPVVPAVQSATARSAAGLGAELTAMTGTAAALEGRMPTAQEFMDNAILLGGLKGAVHTAGRLRRIFAETGVTPDQVAARAATDAALRGELVGPPRADEVMVGVPKAYVEMALAERVKAAIDADPRPEMLRDVISQAERGEVPRLGVERPDPVAYEYVTDKQTAQEVLKGVATLYAGELAAQKRGVVTDQQVARKALKDVSGLEPHQIGTAEPAEVIWGRAHLLRGAANRASGRLKELAQKSEAELSTAEKIEIYAELERVAMFYRDITGAAGEVGRALRILRQIKSDPSMLGEAEILAKGFRTRNGEMTFQQIAKLAADLKDPAQLARFANEAVKATKMEKVIEGWKAAILSGPLTHMANMLGNSMKFAVEIPESAVAAGVGAARRAFSHDHMSLAEFKSKVIAPLVGIKLGASDALTIAGEVWRGAGEHLEKGDIYRHAIEGKKGEVIRTPFRLLQMEDVLFRTVAERAKAYEMGFERALKEGFRPETKEFNERVMQYVTHPEFGLTKEAGEAAIKAVQDAGAESVFTQRLGSRMEIIQRGLAGSPMAFVVPFIRTPANLLSWAVQHSPFFLLSGRWRNDFMAGGPARDKAIARLVIGGALSLTAYELVKEGLITGGGLFDKEERGTKIAAGWQPYSVKIGDEYYSYQRIEPVAKVIGLVADLMEMAEKSGKEEKFKVLLASVSLFGNATISTTYLSGLSGAFNAVTDPARYGERWFEQYASSLVPKIIGQGAMLIDPHKREVDGMVDAIQSQLPFLREKLMPKRDVWGQPEKNERLFAVLPIQKSTESKDKVRSEAMRLELAIADVPDFITEPGPLNQKDRRIDLTAEQRDTLKAISGQFAMDILTPIVNAKDWVQIPDFAKAEVYKRVIEAARKKGRYEALPAESNERMEMRDKITQEILRQVLSAQGSE